MCSIRGIDETNINELCFKLLLASLHTEIIHQNFIQVFLFP